MTSRNGTQSKKTKKRTEMEADMEVFERAAAKFRGKSYKKVIFSLLFLAVLLCGAYLWYELYDGKEQIRKWTQYLRSVTERPAYVSGSGFQAALISFENESSDSRVSKLLTELLLRDLMRKKPDAVNITQGSTSARRRGRFSAVVTGTVLSFSIDTDKRSSTARHKYQAGTRKEETGEYQVAKDRVNRAEEDVEYWHDAVDRAKRKLVREREESSKTRSLTGGLMDNSISIGIAERNLERNTERLRDAQRKLVEVKRELSNIRQYEDVPAYKDYNYTIWDYTKVASLKVSCQVVESSSNNILFSDVVYQSSSSSDEKHDGKSSVGLQSDPLKLASDETLRSEVIRKVSDELSSKIASALVDMLEENKGGN